MNWQYDVKKASVKTANQDIPELKRDEITVATPPSVRRRQPTAL